MFISGVIDCGWLISLFRTILCHSTTSVKRWGFVSLFDLEFNLYPNLLSSEYIKVWFYYDLIFIHCLTFHLRLIHLKFLIATMISGTIRLFPRLLIYRVAFFSREMLIVSKEAAVVYYTRNDRFINLKDVCPSEVIPPHALCDRNRINLYALHLHCLTFSLLSRVAKTTCTRILYAYLYILL